MNAPPWIHTITGRARVVARGRPHVEVEAVFARSAAFARPASCVIANSACADSRRERGRVAHAVPRRLRAAGGSQRRGPTGGAAYGMPRNTCTPSCSTPSTLPLRVAAIVMAAQATWRCRALEKSGSRFSRNAVSASMLAGWPIMCAKARVFAGPRGADRVDAARDDEPLGLDERRDRHLAMRRASSIVSVISVVGLDRAQREPARDRFVGGDPVAGVEPSAARWLPITTGISRLPAASGTTPSGTNGARRRAVVDDEREVDSAAASSCRCRRRAVDRGDERLLERGERVEEVREARARRRRSRACRSTCRVGPSRRGPGPRRTRGRCR